MGWATIDQALADAGLRFGSPTPAQTTGAGHVEGSLHSLGLARDYGDANSDVSGITKALLPYAQGPNAPIAELFSARDGVFYKNGAAITPSDALRQTHYDHVHVGLKPNIDLAAAVLAGKPLAPSSSTSSGGSSSGWGVVGHAGLKILALTAGVGLVVLGLWRGVHAPKEATA